MRLLLKSLLVLLLLGAITAAWWYWPQLHAKRFERFGWDDTSTAVYGQFGDAFGAFTALFTGIAFVAVALTLWLQMIAMRKHQKEVEETRIRAREGVQTATLFALHHEFNTGEILVARQRADKIVGKHPDKTLAEMHDVLTSDEWADIWQVVHAYQRLHLAIKFDQVNISMVGELFGEVFYWWWIHCFERQLIPINRDSSKRIAELKNWFDSQCDKVDIERWINRARQDLKQTPAAPTPGAGAMKHV